jgi:hypothetical protein
MNVFWDNRGKIDKILPEFSVLWNFLYQIKFQKGLLENIMGLDVYYWS